MKERPTLSDVDTLWDLSVRVVCLLQLVFGKKSFLKAFFVLFCFTEKLSGVKTWVLTVPGTPLSSQRTYTSFLDLLCLFLIGKISIYWYPRGKSHFWPSAPNILSVEVHRVLLFLAKIILGPFCEFIFPFVSLVRIKRGCFLSFWTEIALEDQGWAALATGMRLLQ